MCRLRLQCRGLHHCADLPELSATDKSVDRDAFRASLPCPQQQRVAERRALSLSAQASPVEGYVVPSHASPIVDS